MLNSDLAKDLSLEEFCRFRDLLHRQSGIYLEESKLDSLRISLVTRATRLGYSSLGEYYGALARDEQEFNELLNLVTINETSFFRFPAQFDALRNSVLPELMAGKQSNNNHHMRVWSAGCSTGEEPYTIAMSLIDSGIELAGYKPQVLGSDVSTKALARAKAGVYGDRALMNVAPEIITRHFEPVPKGGFRVNDRVRSIVDFGFQNLIKEPYPATLMGGWDIIFCRNVTIYFKVESTRRVVRNFYDSLNPGGYLFIGHSETLTSVSDDFEPVEVGGVFLYRKPVPRRMFSIGVTKRAPRPTLASREATPAPARARTRADETASKPSRGVTPRPASSTSGPDPVEEARNELRQGRPDRVLEIVDTVLVTDPNNADAHMLSAYVHADAGDYDEAMRASHSALAINPLLPAARYILGIIHQRQGDQVRAVSELKKTIYIDADFAPAHLNLANIYKSQRKWDAAAKEYDNALKALRRSPEGPWREFSGGFQADLLVRTCERSLVECRRAMSGA